MRMVRWMCDVKLKDRYPSKELRETRNRWHNIDGMSMCYKKIMMIRWRNAWSMKQRPQTQREEQRSWTEVVEKDCQARKLNKEDAIDRSKWRKLIKDVWWTGWVWVGQCFFWYRPTWTVLDKGPLNCCVCVYRCTLCHRFILKQVSLSACKSRPIPT